MKLTMYDDGRSCPGGCDAHVVLHTTNNGTPNAYLPESGAGTHKRCVPNQECKICFDADPQSCMLAMYRGDGPHPNTFDFTPAFYEQNCPRPGIPRALATQCAALRGQARALEGRLNCFRTPEHRKCADLMAQAKRRQAQDRPVYETCVQQGEAKFNEGRPVAQQRSNDCAYEQRGTGGPNRAGKRWKKLLPGACREGTLVGRDGLDCCSGSLFHDGPLDVECRNFYPRP
ncbi:MAG TPA: hypothetical protein VF591_21905 [Pyrinomonadaceae bacterium]|jgi:hypothetical protein